jgi:curved DNA-binding protein CbpA
VSEDPYQILGVPRAATQSEIRKAYRRRAKELHPDLHPGDKKVEAQFKALSAAYHLLNDPEQRARFDRGEIDASGMERSQQRFYRNYADTDQADRYTSGGGAGETVERCFSINLSAERARADSASSFPHAAGISDFAFAAYHLRTRRRAFLNP